MNAKKQTSKKLTPEEYNSLSLVTPPFIISYPHLFEKGTYEGKETNYNFTMLFKKNVDMTKFKNALHRAKILLWGKDKSKWPEGYERAIQDGDKMADQGYAGYWVLRATSNEPRPVINMQKEEIMQSREIYGGAVCRANIQASVYNVSKKNVGEKFYFKALQKIEDGTKLGNAGASIDAFDSEELDVGSDDPDNYDDQSDDGDADSDSAMW